MKVAIVHEWLSCAAGSERVLTGILGCYPDADVFAVVDFLPDTDRWVVLGKAVRTTFIQKLPFARTHFRWYLPLMPLAIEQIDLSAYDLIISSNHAVAKGVITGPDQLHISYVHSPMRYAWDLQHQYLRQSGLERGLGSWITRWTLHRLRLWDAISANGVDHFIANSDYIRRRIRKTYNREAAVIYPPVDIDAFALKHEKEDFYLTASRLVPYKQVDLIVEAFSRMPDKRLVVIGDGPQLGRVRARARTPNISLMGHQHTEVLIDQMQRARAFIFAAEEDFGLMPVEAQACGTPVIAYGKGGALESVRDWGTSDATGLLFERQHPDALIQAVAQFERLGGRFTPQACRTNAERFRPERFRRELMTFVDDAVRDGKRPLHRAA